MMKLSIIIPIYNVESYIDLCLKSCLKQDLKAEEYEIIVVNDGSRDNTVSIVKKYQEQYSNIKLFNRVNGGQAAARNTGLREAKGEYIWFVDGDDHILENCLKSLLNKAFQNSLDILCFNFKHEYPDGRMEDYKVKMKEDGKVYGGRDFITFVDMLEVPWIALYRREFLQKNNLSFLEGILHEDQEFVPRAYCLAEKIEFVDFPVYYYFQRDGSSMRSKSTSKRCLDLLTVADSLYSFTLNNFEKKTPAYNSMMRRVYFSVTQSLAIYSKDVVSLTEYKKKPYYPMDTSILKGLMKYKIMLANASLRLYLWVYTIVKK